ncbi:MAG: asparagine synthase (glutamine-hydrolyzing) [Gammaproteobacteria bacterium]|nr:asparagine synthase (glutamine-hydrolyzing) [Gammaproteobacteria bacterium]
MCGIAGIYNYKTGRPVERTDLERMARSIVHRGPDAEGFYSAGEVGLAHRRLSIIDPRAGQQPMLDEHGNVIIFNGEVYNYIELRRQLEGPFRTDSDTEVILRGLAQRGVSALQGFIGMFTIAYWNGEELLLARDRLGIKPLYYALTDDGIVFGSEVKAMLASGQVRTRRNDAVLNAYFSTGFVPGEQTAFEGILKLPPGCVMRVGRHGVQIQPYWSLSYSESDISESEARARFEDLLMDAIKLRLRSDVPLGVFLSGGLDSSSIVALLAPEVDRPLETFSVYYQMNGYDETRYARQVAERYGTVHREIEVTADTFVDFLPDFIWHMDEPVTEAASISLYYVSKLARESVTVTLSGEGADEILAGYEIYRYMSLIEQYRHAPASVRNILDLMLRNAPHAKIRKYAELARWPLEQRYLGVSLCAPDILSDAGGSLLSESMRQTLRELPGYAQMIAPLYQDTFGAAPLNRMLSLDTRTWLPDDILVKADKMSMATSIELRVPFLDHRLVEFCATLPVDFKRRGRDVKYLLRSIMRERLPADVLSREKMGFPTPLIHLFRGRLYDLMREIMAEPATREHGVFDPKAVLSLLEAHKNGQQHHIRLWQILVLELWQRRFLDGGVGA